MLDRIRWPRAALIVALPVALLVPGCNRAAPVPEISANSETERRTTVLAAGKDDWPWWRGPQRNAVSQACQVPRAWTQTDNVAWIAPVPGRGHSSPCVWGARVFLTTADQQAQHQRLICFDRATGKQRWHVVVHRDGLMKMHRKNSHASATPACDGRRVYTAFINSGALKVSATDVDGNLVWQTDAGPFTSEHGYGSSPVLYGAMVIVLGDNLTGSFVAALDRESGQILWRTARRTSGRHGSYATPVVADVAGTTQLLVSGMSQVSSYDPVTGKSIWTCEGPAELTACTVAWSDKLVFASGGYPEKELLAIRADGSGDISDSHIVWRTKKGVAYVPSPLHHDGHLFVVNDNGIATCLQAETGTQLGTRRLPGKFSASPILVGGLIYAHNEAGKTYVVKADPSLEVIAENELGDGGFASPAMCGDQVFIRTLTKLYCIRDATASG